MNSPDNPAAGRPLEMVIDFVHHNPGEQPFSSAYLDPAHLRGLGFTGQVSNLHVQAGVTLESFAADLWNGQDEARQWIEGYAEEIRAEFQAARRAGVMALAWTDFVVLPKVLVNRYRDRIASSVRVQDHLGIKGVFTPDIHHPLTQDILRAQIREIFITFPGLDGLVVRVGETYLHDLPHHTGGDPITHGTRSHIILLELLREEICCKLDRTLIYRTWLSGIDEDAAQYLEVARQIQPHPKLLLSIKHCVGDYHRTHRFSPPLGHGEHQQCVEIQCQREYEGKGAFPNYIAAGVIDGFEEDQQLMSPGEPRCLRDIIGSGNIAGLFTWSRGGGWMGPYLKDELWCDINARVLAGWARDPRRTTREVLDQVLDDLGFASPSRALMAEILDLSTRAVLLGVTGSRGDIDTLWTRDEFLGGFEPESPEMKRSVETLLATGRVDATLAELDEAMELWKRIEELAAAVDHDDKERLAFLRTSCTYGRIYQQVIRAGWTIVLKGEAGVRSGAMDCEVISRASGEYHQAWAEWLELALRPECPTLYRDTYCRYITDRGMIPVPGMGASVARYEKLAMLHPEPT